VLWVIIGIIGIIGVGICWILFYWPIKNRLAGAKIELPIKAEQIEQDLFMIKINEDFSEIDGLNSACADDVFSGILKTMFGAPPSSVFRHNVLTGYLIGFGDAIAEHYAMHQKEIPGARALALKIFANHSLKTTKARLGFMLTYIPPFRENNKSVDDYFMTYGRLLGFKEGLDALTNNDTYAPKPFKVMMKGDVAYQKAKQFYQEIGGNPEKVHASDGVIYFMSMYATGYKKSRRPRRGVSD